MSQMVFSRSIVTAAGKGVHDIGLCIVSPSHRKEGMLGFSNLGTVRF
jgi:hypothetical protein